VSRPVRIAVAQYEPHVGELEQNRSQAVLWATSAAEQGADLIVLPELASSGYVFDGEAEAQRSAEDSRRRADRSSPPRGVRDARLPHRGRHQRARR